MLLQALIIPLLPLVVAVPVEKRANPVVTISNPQATITGRAGILDVDTFLAIPFAQPPVGNLRLQKPQPLKSPYGNINAGGLTSPSCPQQFFDVDDNLGVLPTAVIGMLLNTPLFQKVTGQTEDCLTIDVVRPKGTTKDSKLPVLFWIFGGGFELGSTQTYQGGQLLQDAMNNGKPFIYVAVNYRVGGFGFLGGADIKKAGASNLGLLDQRLGLRWVADNIAAFGGDPNKVTIWGESAGAISVLDQMILYNGDNTYNGKPLFRGAIMNSGSIIPALDVDHPKAQAVYDQVVSYTSCSGASDKLQCLRDAPYDVYLNAVNSLPGILSYSSVNLAYLPRPDGIVLTQSPELLIQQGKYADVPFIIGDQEDEGTLFALFQSNVTTTEELVNYFVNGNWFPQSTREQVEKLVASYPDDAAQGSPFRTGGLNNIYPQYKRLAAILGDATFTLTRRAFLAVTSAVRPNTPSWSYLSSYDYGLPILGTLHGSDIIQTFYGIFPNYAARATRGYYYNFILNGNPNVGGGNFPNWPKYSESQQLVNFVADSSSLIKDDFRSKQYQTLVELTSSLRV
ncbi:alpha/beta-hydrolase [Pseudovirgaria hyperparasitica]|uniref:Carboxylic ester hydrolase n=1 Tax=Pseudovirgaria hyperparasitica TaxID=470096 RepID=A0A6A6WKF9_9PEZI|nr:alpha/beta-hydrolase [Pseudovirgaria hyperparasitica]KAF2762648.1 alpha/beta-hydrolase [Pseudovirgaria hyperparasitica]